MKIGLIGGTFDPIHNGHLIMGEYARTALNLDKIIFIPVGIAPHKDNNKITDSAIRVNMIKLAIESNPYFSKSLIEVNKEKVAYTIETITSLVDEYPEDELYFIMGGDSIFEIETWKDSKKLMKLCKFIVLNRGYEAKGNILIKAKELKSLYGMEVQVVNSPIIDISSTEIRNRVKKNLSIKYLVPESLEDYIRKENIYRR